MKLASKGIHPGFETQGRRHQEPKAWLSIAPQKRTDVPHFYKQNPNTQLDDRISISSIVNYFGKLGTFTQTIYKKLVKKETIYYYC